MRMSRRNFDKSAGHVEGEDLRWTAPPPQIRVGIFDNTSSTHYRQANEHTTQQYIFPAQTIQILTIDP